MSSEEISLEEFDLLSDELEREVINEPEILAALGNKSKTATKLQDELSVEKYATMYGRLERMEKKGKLIKRYDGKRAFYAINPDYEEEEIIQ